MHRVEERKRLTESARLLKLRLRELEKDKDKSRQPVNQVAIQAVKDALTAIGRKLASDWWHKEEK